MTRIHLSRARRLGFSFLTFALALFTSTAFADDHCGRELAPWLAACAARQHLALSVDHCADNVAVVAATLGDQSSRIEMKRQGRGFATIGDVSLSPLGDYPDWINAPAPTREAFEALKRCVSEGPPPPFATEETPRDSPRAPPSPAPSLALAIGLGAAWLALLIASGLRGDRARLRARALTIDAGLALAAMTVAVIFRRVAIVPAFFHQNAHGSEWVRFAQCSPMSYGPGYPALFRVGAVAGDESGVFLEQEILGAMAVIGVYAIARSAPLSRKWAFAAAALFGLEPLVGRLARSESYYAAVLSLLVLAMAALLASGPRARANHALTWLGAVIAGALLGLAATIHPVAWLPVGCVALASTLRRGPRRRRVLVGFGAGGVASAVAIAVAAGSVIGVMRGDLGTSWSAHYPSSWRWVEMGGGLALPLIATLALRARIARFLVPLALVVAPAVLDRSTNFLDGNIGRAWLALFLVPLIAALLALGAIAWPIVKRAHRWSVALATIVVLAVAAHHAATFRASTALPTDALEARDFADRMRALPPTSTLHFLAGAGHVLDDLPVYSGCGYRGPRIARHEVDGEDPPIAPGDYWFRGGACATDAGRVFCDSIEARLTLDPIQIEHLPARPSIDFIVYDRDQVDCVLSRVVGVRAR